MRFFNYRILRYKLLECRISTIEERLDKLHDLSLFFQSRFDNNRSDKIKNKIEYLSKKKEDLMVGFQYVS